MGYYQGDFYRGDPGFFSFLGNIAKTAVGFIPGVGPIASKALSLIPAGGRGGRAIQKVGAAIIKHPVLSAAGAAGALAVGAGMGGRALGRAGMVPAGMRGYHIERKGKHAGQMIKNRRMNPYNPRALRRAVRRAHAFAHMAKKILRFVSPRAPRGRAVFKHRRRKK